MKKKFTTYSTDEKGIIHAHTEERTYIKYSVNTAGDITMSAGVLSLMMQRIRGEKIER